MNVVPTVRVATLADLPDIRRLLALPRGFDLAGATRSAPTERHYLLVVDSVDGGLAAAAQVSIAAGVVHLKGLAMDPRCTSPALEARIIGVAEALGAAFHCTSFDVPLRSAA